ncbi:hypothetical protein E2C01_052481 [Portunus trituberculatus]|uniref:Uncharacterized protein n=1 Tax=Portunus trituberculatus TaxID=210409 RepID=A0A5B7GLN7_PORTR|nr:hypothetical protein [Portunus trituberculatus]
MRRDDGKHDGVRKVKGIVSTNPPVLPVWRLVRSFTKPLHSPWFDPVADTHTGGDLTRVFINSQHGRGRMKKKMVTQMAHKKVSACLDRGAALWRRGP